MIVDQRMGKALAFFAGGFGIAKLCADGEVWKFTVRRPRFDDRCNIILDEANVEIHNIVVREHGLKQGFMRALDEMHRLNV